MLPMTVQQLFGAFVRHHRVRQGLSTVQLEEIEDGRGVGELDTAVAMDLADFCGVPLSVMLGEPWPARRGQHLVIQRG